MYTELEESGAPAATELPEGIQPVRNPNNGHWYAVVDERVTWEEAKARAESLIDERVTWEEAKARAESLIRRRKRGHLATLTSAEETHWVQENVLPRVQIRSSLWMGGFQSGGPEPAGGWRWVTGEAWEWSDWYPGEPSNTHGKEHCLELIGRDHADYHRRVGKSPLGLWLWNDREGSARRAFIVEFEPMPVKPNAVRNPNNGHLGWRWNPQQEPSTGGPSLPVLTWLVEDGLQAMPEWVKDRNESHEYGQQAGVRGLAFTIEDPGRFMKWSSKPLPRRINPRRFPTLLFKYRAE